MKKYASAPARGPTGVSRGEKRAPSNQSIQSFKKLPPVGRYLTFRVVDRDVWAFVTYLEEPFGGENP